MAGNRKGQRFTKLLSVMPPLWSASEFLLMARFGRETPTPILHKRSKPRFKGRAGPLSEPRRDNRAGSSGPRPTPNRTFADRFGLGLLEQRGESSRADWRGGAWSDRWSRTNIRGYIYVTVIGVFAAVPGIMLAAKATTFAFAMAGLVIYGLYLEFCDSTQMPIICRSGRFALTGRPPMARSISCNKDHPRRLGDLRHRRL